MSSGELVEVERAIRHAVESAKLRLYVQQHGAKGLDGLLRLAERHSRLASDALVRLAKASPDDGAAE